MKSNLIICTVGTSLLQKKVGVTKGERNQFPPIDISTNLAPYHDWKQETIEEKLSEKEHPFNKFLFKPLKELIPKEQLGKRGEKYDPKNNPDLLPAELSSLYLFYWPDGSIPDEEHGTNNKDIVVFLPSETNHSLFCACCLRKYLEEREPLKSKISDVKIIIIAGLQTKDTKTFEEKAILNLSDILKEEIETGHKKDYNVVLNITGGYKGTIPYLTLFGMLYQGGEEDSKEKKISIKYLYEDSKELITLPHLPVAFDIFTWRNYRGFVNAMPHLEANVAKLFLDKILPVQIGGLFEKVKDEYRLTTLGTTLEKKYNEEKEGELTPYGCGYLLTDKIQDGKKKKALRDCINRWQYLWLGDLIPETVEHARGHTQRVLELAAQILYPILNEEEEENFFGDKDQTDNNLIALISAIWLHDLGHSGNYLECKNTDETIKDVELNDEGKIQRDIKGFPSLVREMHHLLSWYLISKDRVELFNKYLFSWDSIPGDDNEKLRRFLRDDLDIGWVKNAKIPSKSDDGKTIIIKDDNENLAEITMDEKKEKAILKISNGRTHDLKVKKENNKLKIYESNPAFDNDLIEAVRQICLYHRGKMPVLEGDEEYECIGIKVKKPLENLQTDVVNIPLLGALLRIADGGDVQKERTISENYTAMRFLQNRREIEKLKQEEEKLREMVNFDGCSQLPGYLKYLKEIADDGKLEINEEFKEITEMTEKEEEKLQRIIKTENPNHYNDALFEFLVGKCVQKFIKGTELEDIDAPKRIILRNWLSTLDQYVFKKSPGPHFEKHAGISAVMYLPDKPDGKNGKNEYHYKVLAIHKKGKTENAETVLKAITKEYKKVKKILNDNRIYFDSFKPMEEENGENEDVL